MADYTLHKQSDLRWVRASMQIAAPADGTHVVCPIPKNTLVTNIIINKTVGFTSPGATFNIGFTGNGETADTDFFMSSVTANPTAVGLASIHQGGLTGSGGKYFTTAGAITVTTDDNGGTAGTFQVFVEYTQIKN